SHLRPKFIPTRARLSGCSWYRDREGAVPEVPDRSLTVAVPRTGTGAVPEVPDRSLTVAVPRTGTGAVPEVPDRSLTVAVPRTGTGAYPCLLWFRLCRVRA